MHLKLRIIFWPGTVKNRNGQFRGLLSAAAVVAAPLFPSFSAFMTDEETSSLAVVVIGEAVEASASGDGGVAFR